MMGTYRDEVRARLKTLSVAELRQERASALATGDLVLRGEAERELRWRDVVADR